jgi:hypothetical protein
VDPGFYTTPWDVNPARFAPRDRIGRRAGRDDQQAESV